MTRTKTASTPSLAQATGGAGAGTLEDDPASESTPLRTAAIAQRLHLAPKTVSNHLTAIFAKLEVADRAEAIARAREGGLGR